jgi:hypothetical protein
MFRGRGLVSRIVSGCRRKSERGIATPKVELNLIERRLKRARTTSDGQQAIPVAESSGNVFADLGLAEPEEEPT